MRDNIIFNCGYEAGCLSMIEEVGKLKKENASLKDRLKYEVEMIGGAANDEIKKLNEENARLRNEIELLKKEWVGL